MKPSRLRSKSANPPEEALKTALRFLGRRARSEAEITEHLERKGYSQDLTTLILEKLRASRYAGDGAFARDWTRSRVEDRGYGPLRIEQELRAKRIDESLILASLKECFGAGQESKNAMQALQKRFGRDKVSDPRTVRHAAAFLQRRGYSETVILDLLRGHED